MQKKASATGALIKGAAILSVAALISKFLGLVYRMPYQNITGDAGLFVYTKVYPLYSTLLIIATAGFPIAISKIVSEKLAVGDVSGARRVFRISSVVLSVTGLIVFSMLYFGAPVIARWMQDDMLVLPIRSVSFALLVVPVMAVMRGYFQGHQNMVPTAVSQVVEQLVRVATILLLAYWFMTHGGDIYKAGAGAVFGAFTGAVSSFVVLLYYWLRNKEAHGHVGADGFVREQEPAGALIARLFRYALPICFGALVLPLFQLTDSFTVTKMLLVKGMPFVEAREWEGAYNRGQPLVQFASFFATALSLSLVPSIAEAKAKGREDLIARRTELALRLTILTGLPASIGLAVVAEPVNITLYADDKGSLALSVLALTTIFSTIGITSAGILQGLGQVMLPAKNLLLGAIVKLACNVLLIPLFGITGAALATVLGYFVAALLNLFSIARHTQAVFSLREFLVKPFVSVAVMSAFVLLSEELVARALEGLIAHQRLFALVITLIVVPAGAVAYALALLVSGTLRKQDLLSVPGGNRLGAFLEKWRLLKE
ncbi:oligosaccharide flippase family protein [Bacillaceae bacterium]